LSSPVGTKIRSEFKFEIGKRLLIKTNKIEVITKLITNSEASRNLVEVFENRYLRVKALITVNTKYRPTRKFPDFSKMKLSKKSNSLRQVKIAAPITREMYTLRVLLVIESNVKENNAIGIIKFLLSNKVTQIAVKKKL
jgi:hypothetical protein